MFTGIIKKFGVVEAKRKEQLSIRARWPSLKRGASVAVNGACLTAVRRSGAAWGFDVSPETFRLTNLNDVKPGDKVNLEMPLKAADLIGGHFLSGHVDACCRILERKGIEGGFLTLRVSLPRKLGKLVALKGSIAVDGISLTVTRVGPGYFETVLIPETLKATTLGFRRTGDRVNIEVDLLARYLSRLLDNR